ncbi:hypothetical protein GUJ93_ZPchr1061g2832 [Zizania palustris]|uniref:Glutaredoxin domain-containing protein n=1 Tax=Zizania palustris TaxID=103762 RepID=A0A8J5RA78_ZIZPA|nr:hypothetical protein GUJ93_ZPchr1061g2832 [Zizania palustris]
MAASASAAAARPLSGAPSRSPCQRVRSSRGSPLSLGPPLLLGASASRLARPPPARRAPSRCGARRRAAGWPGDAGTLDKVVASHKVVLFMKGTKDFPQCGFSHTVVQILRSLDVPFETLDVLANEALRQGLKEYSSWPTFPQLYIDGEFFGGCDITVGTLSIACLTQAHCSGLESFSN